MNRTTAWFHCFAGVAGDMTLGALVDAGADRRAVAEIVGRLRLGDVTLTYEQVTRCGVAATHAVVAIGEQTRAGSHRGQHRPYREIRELLLGADLPTRVHQRSLAAFDILATVEGAIHRTPAAEVEFHEVGSLDAIVDVVGSCAALEVLGVDHIVCSPVAVSRGSVVAAHGLLPTPAPAVMAMLAQRGAPAFGIDTGTEIATPTGVALMTALADQFGPLPAMTVRSAGYGAGTADTPGRPNVVQVVVGLGHAPTATASPGQPVRLLEANLDDATGEVIAHTIARLLDAGAHDAWATPIVMKKGRPAYTVHVLCEPTASSAIAGLLISESGSLGVRGSILERWPQGRAQTSVEVEGHRIRVKLGAGRVKVEHDDAARAAEALGWPLRVVLSAAEVLGWAERDDGSADGAPVRPPLPPRPAG